MMPGAGDCDWPELAYDSEPETTEPGRENTMKNAAKKFDGPIYPNVTVELIGQDGNAFAILGAVRKALRKAGVSNDEVERFADEAMSGDYDNLLQTCMKWVDVR